MNKRELKSQNSIDISLQMNEIMQSYQQTKESLDYNQMALEDKYKLYEAKYFHEKPKEQIFERARTDETENQTAQISPTEKENVTRKVVECESLLKEIKQILVNQSSNQGDLAAEVKKYKHKYKEKKLQVKQLQNDKVFYEKQIFELQSVLQEKNNFSEKQKNSQQELNRIIQINQFLSFLLDLQAKLGVIVNINSYFPNFASSCKLISETEFSFSKKEIIGQGGFSTVYKGIYNCQDVAIKVCDIQKNELQGILEELFAQLSLTDFTVKLLAVHIPSMPQGLPVIFPIKFHLIMELMYKNLFTLFFIDKIKLSMPQKLSLIVRILEGIEFLHSRNFVHCDLSLANIMVNEQLQNVKLLDFGLAKYLQKGGTKKTQKLGYSARYSPREYLLSGSDNKTTVSTKCDIWSFGVIAYEIFGEKQSWNWLQPNQIMVKIIQGVPFFDENAKLGISSIDSILEKCLSHEYQFRPSANELKQFFQQLL